MPRPLPCPTAGHEWTKSTWWSWAGKKGAHGGQRAGIGRCKRRTRDARPKRIQADKADTWRDKERLRRTRFGGGHLADNGGHMADKLRGRGQSISRPAFFFLRENPTLGKKVWINLQARCPLWKSTRIQTSFAGASFLIKSLRFCFVLHKVNPLFRGTTRVIPFFQQRVLKRRFCLQKFDPRCLYISKFKVVLIETLFKEDTPYQNMWTLPSFMKNMFGSFFQRGSGKHGLFQNWCFWIKGFRI